MRILIATDQTGVPATLRSMIDGISGVEVVQQATNPQLALHLIDLLQPDLLIIDVSGAAQAEWDRVLASATANPKLRVLLLSRDGSEDSLLRALRLGIAAYVSKEAASTELPQAVDTLRKGGLYLSSAIVKFIARERLSHVLARFAAHKAKPEDSAPTL